jgi:predicted O-methyltransferase YrrM
MEDDAMQAASSSLDEPRVRGVLDRLHREASKDGQRFARMGLTSLVGLFTGSGLPRFGGDVHERAQQLKDVYISISPEQGVFAYLTARGVGARRIVEFGTSFGVSTIYLAAAVRDNGGGIVVGTELEAGKVAGAQTNLQDAGLGAYVDIRLGDAVQTLAGIDGPVDMVLMDGWKGLYLPLIKMLTPRLRDGAIVLADDVNRFKKALAPYVTYVQDPKNGFQSVTLPLGDGLEYSMKVREV